MNPQTTIVVLTNLFTAIVVSILGYFLTRKKDKSTVLFNTTTAYNNMLNAMQSQINSQADQIKSLESKLQSYIDLINTYAKKETEYVAQISRLENQLKIARKSKNETTS